MSEKIKFSPNLETDQPNFLVKRSSGDIDVMVPTGQRLKSFGLDADGNEDVQYKHEMRSQQPIAEGSLYYETRRVPEASMLPEAQMKLGEELAGVEPMDDLERRNRIAKNFAGPVLRSEVVMGSEDETGINKDGLITGMPKHLRPEDYVQPEATDGNASRRVPVAMPANPHGALGFPSREEYFKSLGQKPDSHN